MRHNSPLSRRSAFPDNLPLLGTHWGNTSLRPSGRFIFTHSPIPIGKCWEMCVTKTSRKRHDFPETPFEKYLSVWAEIFLGVALWYEDAMVCFSFSKKVVPPTAGGTWRFESCEIFGYLRTGAEVKATANLYIMVADCNTRSRARESVFGEQRTYFELLHAFKHLLSVMRVSGLRNKLQARRKPTGRSVPHATGFLLEGLTHCWNMLNPLLERRHSATAVADRLTLCGPIGSLHIHSPSHTYR